MTRNGTSGPTNEPARSRILLPQRHARGEMESWLEAIDPYLPVHLRRKTSEGVDISSRLTTLDLALVLCQAQDASLDIISHIGVEEGRWPTVMWMVKKLAEDGRRTLEPPIQMLPLPNVIWPKDDTGSLRELTNHSFRLGRVRPTDKLSLSLDNLTAAPDTIHLQHKKIKQALGQLWRSLGYMILVAAEKSNDEEPAIMPHVLEIIAFLHHAGFVPDSVYTYRPRKDQYALQQPPTLHMLSSKILTALSDASWNAHEASVKTAKDRVNASYFLGHEIPGSRYKIEVTEIAPELWLELVLWSCLRGGYILDGAAILEQLAGREDSQRWGLISWREIMQAEEKKAIAPSRAWNLFAGTEKTAAGPQDRARTRRTISGEIVTAFVDGLVNQMRLGVGNRGAKPERLVDLLKTMKVFLDGNNLSLGSAAWDAIMARLLESGGIDPEKQPELLLHIIDLAPSFGEEVSAANASTTSESDVPYFFEPTTIPLSLLHRTMRAFVGNGDIDGAIKTLMQLQRHTDENKEKSVQQFFKMLKSVPPLRTGEPFTPQLPPVDFPGFHTKLPVPLLARLLDLATEFRMYDFGQWLLFSSDLDGPLIGPELYSHRNIAASIVRFATLTGENDLVVRIVKQVGVWSSKHQQQRMPVEVLIALFCSQLNLRRWDAVRGMQKYVEETSTFRPRPVILSTFAAELLRTSRDPEEAKTQAQEAFTDLLFAWESLLMYNIRNELYCILAIMSTVASDWQNFCSDFLAVTTRQPIKLSTDDFNRLLGGVLDGYGSRKAKDVVDQWCYKTPKIFASYRAPGGLPTMPQYRVSRSDEWEDLPPDIELVQGSGARFVLQGRIRPNRQTIRVIVRKVQDEVELWRKRGGDLTDVVRKEVRDTLQWAARLLYYMGLDHEEIVRDMGSSLAKLAELEAPAARAGSEQISSVEGL